MMPLLRLDKVSLVYGPRPLLDHVQLDMRSGERVCLVGRNGEGKSSLMRIGNGELAPDDGEVWRRPGVRIAHLAQEASVDSEESVFDIVAGGLAESGKLLSQYHRAAAALAHDHSTQAIARLSDLQQQLEAVGAWTLEQRVEQTLSRLGLDGAVSLRSLSGGWRRRAMLARALVCDPDLLLLDEPTNHLDIEAITWLEEFLAGYTGALLFITHDRAFLRRLATRIVELDRGQLTSWPGDYDTYLRKKAEQLAAEEQHNALFDKKLSQEEAWIRQGIKARRTRNEGRVRALEALRRERGQRRERVGKADLQLEAAEASGKLVFECEHVDFNFGDKPVVRDLSTRIFRGDRIGIIGPNGAGKSTMIKQLLGELQPQHGLIRRGTKLQIAYFDQQREQLDPAVTVMNSVGEGRETVTVNGQTRHVAGYLRDFLFPADRLRSPVSTLSGGERNRRLLARLFARPANLLVMDEPTNDLDVETLELLEELLTENQGTLLMVSHDRAFLDNVVTGTLVFEGEAHVNEYVGGYSDWRRYRQDTAARAAAPSPVKNAAPASKPSAKTRKLSFNEQRELDALPAKIEALEAEQAALLTQTNDPLFYKKSRDEIGAMLARVDAVERELEACYARWAVLEPRSRRGAAGERRVRARRSACARAAGCATLARGRPRRRLLCGHLFSVWPDRRAWRALRLAPLSRRCPAGCDGVRNAACRMAWQCLARALAARTRASSFSRRDPQCARGARRLAARRVAITTLRARPECEGRAAHAGERHAARDAARRLSSPAAARARQAECLGLHGSRSRARV